MANSDSAWNDMVGTGGSKKNDPIDSVIDALKSVMSTNSGAILGSGWNNTSVKKNPEYKTKSTEVTSKSSWGESFSTTSNQDESENSWNSWKNGTSSWGNSNNSSGWGNEDNQNYPTNNINSAYTDDRRSYQDVNRVPDLGTNSYTDNNDRYYESTDTNELNQVNNNDDMNNINNFSNEYDEWSQPSQQQKQHHHSYYEPQSPSESESSTDQNSETNNQDDIKVKLSAWHSLADPNAKERDDGLGGGQLHRRGKNFIPVDEATVLAIQQKGNGGHRRPSRKFSEKPIPRNKVISKPPIKPVVSSKPISTSQKPPATQKISNANVPVKMTAPQNQKQNTQPTPPNLTQQKTQQTSQKPSPPPSQSLQRQPLRDVPQPSRDTSQPSRDILQPSRDVPQPSRDVPQPSRDVSQSSRDTSRPLRDSSPSSRPQRSQPQLSQQSQQSQKQNSWSPKLVNTPFWESSSPPASPPPIQKQHANETISNKSQSIRHQSPAHSPRPVKPVQDYTLPYIPPEFDSTPYRKQPSPSPVRDKPPMYNKNFERNNNAENQRNKYYDDYDESDFERQENKSGNILGHNEPEKEQPSRVNRYDRGQLLLTINVELSEGKTQAIEVHVNDDPMDLAKDFCDLWKVTNPVVMPALECLIKEEKEKRLGFS